MTYAYSQSLSLHYRTVHSSPTEFPCQFPGCDKSYLYQPGLLHHHRRDHSNRLTSDLLYQCEFCDAAYDQKKTIYIHLVHHHDQRHLLALPPKPGTDIAQVNSVWASNSKHSNGTIEGATTMPNPTQPITHVGIPELIKQSASSTRIQPFKDSMLQSLVRPLSSNIIKGIFELITHY